MTPNEIIVQFKGAVHNIYGEKVDKIFLYGSRARGDFRDDSDFDFLVVLKDEEGAKTNESKVFDFTFRIWEKTYIRVHFLPMTSEKFYNAKTPLLYWVRKEGIEI